MLWSFFVTKFIAILASFDSKCLCAFFKYSANFQGHVPKSELTNVWYANFIKFKYEIPNPLDEWALEKINTQCFYLHFANSNCKVIFSHFILNIKKKLFPTLNLHKIYLFINFWPVLTKNVYVLFSNIRPIFKVMRQNRNLPTFDMLILPSSNMKYQTLMMNEHLKK